MKITCNECGLGPLNGRALYRDKGALFHNGISTKGVGPLFCAAHAPAKVKRAILESPRIDRETKGLVI